MSNFNMLSWIFMLFTVMALSGCANYIKTEDLKETHVIRTPIKTETVITENMNSETVIEIKGEQSVKETVVTNEVNSKYDIYTPYKGVRKLWEMPLGLFLLPTSLIVCAADVCLLGLIPNKYSEDLIVMSLTGLNPFMNWKNPDRIEKKLTSTETKQIDAIIEILTKPAENLNLCLLTGEGAAYNFKLDEDGRLKVMLVKLAVEKLDTPENLRYLDIFIDNSKGKLCGRIVISRELGYKLLKAKHIVAELNTSTSPEKVADLILELEKLGFIEYAFDIENQFKDENKFSKEFSERFEKEIKKHFNNL